MTAFRTERNRKLTDHTKKAKSGVSTSPKGSYLGKEKDKCGASANRPNKSGNCCE